MDKRCFHESVCTLAAALVHNIRRNLATVSVVQDVDVIEADVNPCSWSPPPQGVLKFNVEVAFNPASRVAVLAMVLGRSNGSVLACGILKKQCQRNQRNLLGLVESEESRFSDVVVESDSLIN
ncbi:hypothetical protein CCACVL1_07517 [Corchorus capsularis]|uniref:Uncharacterized protein n=1 Tax=Corchorus capsularis TaxID=210143 RepID=A0A1R3J5G6_COCAP|nr:hypothetical protein CCACVL1_07517 [Corchorus capsularis]